MIQDMRKEAGFSVSDRILISLEADEIADINRTFFAHETYILTEVLGERSSVFGKAIPGAEVVKSEEIEGNMCIVYLKKA